METLTTDVRVKTRPSYGLCPPDGVTGAMWGARAIFSENREAYKHNYTKAGKPRKRGRIPTMNVELLWDRCDAIGESTAIKTMCEWLDTVGLKLLRLAAEDLDTSEDREVMIHQDGYIIRANPRESYGYLYILCYACENGEHCINKYTK